jgi:REP-associated tyrosine transposase
VCQAQEWAWSSYRATAGEVSAPLFLTTDWLLRAFADSRSEAVARYRSFVAEGIGAPCPWSALKNQIYLGSGAFVAKLQQRLIDPERPLDDVPKRQRRPVAKPLEHFRVYYKDRDQALAEAYGTGMYRMEAIAEHCGVSRMTVSRAVKRGAAHRPTSRSG